MSSIATKIHNRIKSKLRAQILRVRRFLSLYQWPRIPEPPLWQFPAGMTILAVGGTGVRVIDNFVSREEARQLIDLYRQQLKRSTVIGPDYKSIRHGYRTSSDALIQLVDADPLVHRIIYRAATMVGLPFSHAERFSLTRYQNGEYYKIHSDHDGSINADRLYTVLVYLSDLAENEGGETMFSKLNLVAQPICGRAVVWPNSYADKSLRPESLHSALPVLVEGAEKWVAQLWFRPYNTNNQTRLPERQDRPAGVPLEQGDALPRGVSLPDDTQLAAEK